jgi:hypothetical protein
MGDVSEFDDKVWDRFFDFLLCDEEPSREEVQDHLRTFGIDVAPALKRVQQALQSSKARAALEAAKMARPSLVARIGQVISPVAERLRDKLHDVIARRFTGSEQAAYFRKLEGAASEEDLQSLLDDMERLETLSEDD